MSDIKVGSEWNLKSEGSEVYTVKNIALNPDDGLVYVFLDKMFEGWSIFSKEDFLRKFKPRLDMVSHPPHYKDASGIECIEVTSQGRKDDSAKRRYSLLPTGTVNHVVDVLEFGAIKYAPDNWQKVPDARRRYYDAAMRHIDSWFGGEVKDIETGLPHLAHAVCCLLFLIWFDNKA